MSDPVVCSYLTETLCVKGGRLGLAELRQHVGLSEQQLRETLQAAGPERFLLLTGSGKEPEVLALTAVRVCPRKQCEGCDRLHLCKLHLMGRCGRRDRDCKYSHDITSAENKKVLKTHELSRLSESELRILLLQNDPFLLPDVCQLYNNKANRCSEPYNCSKLHICRHFLHGGCKFFPCKRSHNFLDSHALRLLKNGGIDEKMALNIQNIYDHKHAELHKKEKPYHHHPVYKPRETSEENLTNKSREKQKPSFETAEVSTVHVPTSEDPSSNKTHQSKLHLLTGTRSKVEGKKDDPSASSLKDNKEDKCDEICLFYVWKYCKHNEQCKSVHYHLPYRWQVYNGITWNDLSMMEEIEKAYCDPKNSSIAGMSINFQTMTCSSSLVRRLSTPSSVVNPTFLLTTKWIWYWKNDQGQWTEYGTQGEQNIGNSPSSDILENLYLADPETNIQFQVGLYYYQLSFKEMTQLNISSKTKRQVCRRPKFVSYEEVQKIKERGQRDDSISNQACPPHWDQSALPDFGYKEVEISNISSEYQEIKKQFEQTMTNYTIIKVLRIQNPSLWKVFQWQKEQMKRQSGGEEVKESLLFHGTMGCLLEDICRHNFDWRICVSNGNLYGKGSYFAKDASYSHGYCQSAGKSTVMFMARVLVGDYAKGRADYVRPPAKSGGGFRLYDSCVDNVASPSIFVVFEKNQIYPEYLIEYKKAQQKCIIS
ncbi:zinc finger CCCH-type antiviral protein 1-like isoform X1 [Centrocercus urophasianus]|uniref:zinc finger CCCH-type antiviral protein 1-like isoform X1 n=2 Tax=Centrocercus urophasianus TaxID=9002 RepID=UPI001C647ED1|nr:zinc finger CCCH-type antiviral protein 1-like isoform X1 [Centrocercus urophasianus]